MIGRLTAWTGFVLAFSALHYAARAAEGKPPADVLFQYSTAAGALVEYGVILGIVLLIARGPRTRELLALRRPRSWGKAAALSFAVLVGIYAGLALLEPLLHAGREQGLTPPGWDPDRAGAYAANFAVIAGAAPIVEELAFRGLGFSLLERFGRPVAIAVVGLAFGLTHGLVAGLPILVAFGIGLALLRSLTGSVYPGMAVHAVFNAVALILAVLDLPTN